MKPSRILKWARLRIKHPAHWTKGAHGRDDDGQAISPSSPEARCWCAEGAIIAATREKGGNSESAFERLRKATRRQELFRWNDAKVRTHADVMAAFDRAIALAESEGQ